MNNKKLTEKILKEAGYGEVKGSEGYVTVRCTIFEAIKLTIAEKDAQKDLFIRKLKKVLINFYGKDCGWCEEIDKINKEVFGDEN